MTNMEEVVKVESLRLQNIRGFLFSVELQENSMGTRTDGKTKTFLVIQEKVR